MASYDIDPFALVVESEKTVPDDGPTSSTKVLPPSSCDNGPNGAHRKSGISAWDAIEFSSDENNEDDEKEEEEEENFCDKSINNNDVMNETCTFDDRRTQTTSSTEIGKDDGCSNDDNFRYNNNDPTDNSVDGSLRYGFINANENFQQSEVTPSTKHKSVLNDPSLNVGVDGDRKVAARSAASSSNLFVTLEGEERIVLETANGHCDVAGPPLHTTNDDSDNNRDDGGGDKGTLIPENLCRLKRLRTENQLNCDSGIMPQEEEGDTPSIESNERTDDIKEKTYLQHTNPDGGGVAAAASSNQAYTDDKDGNQKEGGDEEIRNIARLDATNYSSSKWNGQKSDCTSMAAKGSTPSHPLGLGAASSFSNPNTVSREKNNKNLNDRHLISIEMKCKLPLKGNGGYYWKTLTAFDACPLCHYAITDHDKLLSHMTKFHSDEFRFNNISCIPDADGSTMVNIVAEARQVIRNDGTEFRAKRQYFKSKSRIPILDGHHDRDSDDESTDSWYHEYRDANLDDYIDVESKEREVMKMWNRFMGCSPVTVADKEIPSKVHAFLTKHGINLKHYEWEIYQMMITFWEHRLLSSENVEDLLQKFHQLIGTTATT